MQDSEWIGEWREARGSLALSQKCDDESMKRGGVLRRNLWKF